MFSGKFGLPVVWPFESYGRFPSGGIGFGNVNVELVGSEHGQSGLAGVALEPTSLSEVLGQLDTQGLEHGPPEPFSQTDSSGAERLLWTTIDIKTLPPADAIFFCKYNFDVDERRERIRRELKDHGGGPLGIEALAELVIGVKDLHAAQHEWSVLLGPVASGKEILWHAGSGPAIRMIAAKEDRLVLPRVKVKSLEAVRAFLKREHILGANGEREISIDPAQVAGADISPVQ